MITLLNNDVLYASAGTANAVQFAVFGDLSSSNTSSYDSTQAKESYSVISAGVLGTTPSVIAQGQSNRAILVKRMMFLNVTASQVAVSFYVNGSAATNQVWGANIPANGKLSYGEDGWSTYDANGARVVSLANITLTGDVTGSGSTTIATTLATTGVTAGSYGTSTSVGSFTVDAKGRLTAASNVAIAFPVTSVFGRTGAVTAAQGDYTPAQIGTSAQGTELAGLAGLSTTGAVQRTGAGTYNTVTLGTMATQNANAVAITGGQIGTATSNLIGFYGATPVTQRSTTGTTAGFSAGAGTQVVSGSTFTGGTGTSAYTIGDIVLALKQYGLLAS